MPEQFFKATDAVVICSNIRIGGGMCNYIVFGPKYWGGVLVGEMALMAGAVIRRVCEEMDIEIIGMAVNPDHEGLFIKCLPKYSVSYLSRVIKRRSSRELKKGFALLKEWCGDYLWALSCYHDFVGNGWDVVEEYITAHNSHEYYR